MGQGEKTGGQGWAGEVEAVAGAVEVTFDLGGFLAVEGEGCGTESEAVCFWDFDGDVAAARRVGGGVSLGRRRGCCC